jgi:hypothetical protein
MIFVRFSMGASSKYYLWRWEIKASSHAWNGFQVMMWLIILKLFVSIPLELKGITTKFCGSRRNYFAFAGFEKMNQS